MVGEMCPYMMERGLMLKSTYVKMKLNVGWGGVLRQMTAFTMKMPGDEEESVGGLRVDVETQTDHEERTVTLEPGDSVVFYTDGVKLVIEDSTVLSELRSLEEKGVRLIVCQTCLNHYGVMEKLEVGIVGGMTDIIEAQWRADKVLTI